MWNVRITCPLILFCALVHASVDPAHQLLGQSASAKELASHSLAPEHSFHDPDTPEDQSSEPRRIPTIFSPSNSTVDSSAKICCQEEIVDQSVEAKKPNNLLTSPEDTSNGPDTLGDRPSKPRKKVTMTSRVDICYYNTFDPPTEIPHQEDFDVLDNDSQDELSLVWRHESKAQEALLRIVESYSKGPLHNPYSDFEALDFEHVVYDEELSLRMSLLIVHYNEDRCTVPRMLQDILTQWVDYDPELVSANKPLLRDLCANAEGPNSIVRLLLKHLKYSRELVQALLQHGINRRSLGTVLGEELQICRQRKDPCWLEIGSLLCDLFFSGHFKIVNTVRKGFSPRYIVEALLELAETVGDMELQWALQCHVNSEYDNPNSKA